MRHAAAFAGEPARLYDLHPVASAVSAQQDAYIRSRDFDRPTVIFDLEMLRAVRAVVDVPVIASGGAGRTEDFPPAVEAGANAVLAASVFHFGTLSIADVKAGLSTAGHPVRRSRVES